MRVSVYLRKHLYYVLNIVNFGVVILEVKKVTYNSRIKPLLILIVCICLFAGASCVHAADIDDAQAGNQSSIDAASDMSAPAMDAGDSIQTNHISEPSNETHFSDDCEKSDFGVHGNDSEKHINPFCMVHEDDCDDHINSGLKLCGDDSDNQFDSMLMAFLDSSDMGFKSAFRVYGDSFDECIKSVQMTMGCGCEKHIKSNPNFHKIHACGEKIKHNSKRAQHNNSLAHEYLKCEKQSPDIAFVNAIGTHMEDTIIKADFTTCQCTNSTGSSVKETSHDCGVTGQSSSSCCENENCSCYVDMKNGEVMINEIGDDSTCCCNDHYAQFNTTVGEETASSRSRNSKGQDTCQSADGGYAIPSNANLEGEFALDLADLLYGDLSRFDCNGLNIGDEYPQADIEDYNMEYYIFTNPDIIIGKANVYELPKASTKTIYNTNHCLIDLDAYPTNFNLHNFNIELSLKKCITDDNYFPIETTLFMLTEAYQDNLPVTWQQMNLYFFNVLGGIASA